VYFKLFTDYKHKLLTNLSSKILSDKLNQDLQDLQDIYHSEYSVHLEHPEYPDILVRNIFNPEVQNFCFWASALSRLQMKKKLLKLSKGKKLFTGIFLLFLVSVFQLASVAAQEKTGEAEKKGGEAAGNTVENRAGAKSETADADKEKAEKEIAALRVQIETLEKENAALRAKAEEISNLQSSILNLQSQADAANKAKQDIEKQTVESLVNLEALEKDKAALQTQISMVNKIKKVFERKAADLREELDAAKAAQNIAEQNAAEFRAKAEASEKETAAFRIKADAAAGESAELKTRLAEWRDTLCPVLQSKWADGTIGEREDKFRKTHCLAPADL
jgi:hypothetical protein